MTDLMRWYWKCTFTFTLNFRNLELLFWSSGINFAKRRKVFMKNKKVNMDMHNIIVYLSKWCCYKYSFARSVKKIHNPLKNTLVSVLCYFVLKNITPSLLIYIVYLLHASKVMKYVIQCCEGGEWSNAR